MKEEIEKYIEGNYSNKELEDAISILNDRSAQPKLEKVMNGFWRKCSNDTVGNPQFFDQILSNVHHEINLTHRDISISRKVYFIFSKVAAIVIVPLLIALIYFANDSLKSSYVAQNTITVPLGAVSQFKLPDGTKVWLNSGSKFTYPSSFQEANLRLVHLEGEAYFDVQKNLDLPFVIDMKNLDVKVTGTAFNIRSYDDENQMTVALVEGSVNLGQLNELDGTFSNVNSLVPNEVATLNKVKNKMDIQKLKDINKYISWKEGRTVFDNDPIDAVIARFEKMYNVDIIVDSDELKQYRFTLTFINETMERALRILELSSPLSYEIVECKGSEAGVFGKRTIILKKAKI
ncbi:FecR family protein [Labilibaculum antarcticum]|uniref:FecR protein domain-containing protein n=1 Tax=Labilibaculum antarcticum TaxID=1717717 RepID=A0A1Y1CHY2_9BACT|nr:FecR domain-containing protein [Labilibaculum antarcticum]BAX79986.1 hypothetical protein ALGA_1610 [Labilibaculum antarcticum]